MSRWGYIVFLLLAGMVGQGCSSRAIHEAETVVAQADSLWQAGLMYGIDAGDSLSLAQAYKTLEAIPLPFREGLGLGLKRFFDHLADIVHEVQFQPIQVDVVDLSDIFSIILAEDDIRDTCSFRCEQFFFYAADRQHFAAKRHLSGHGDAGFNEAFGEGTY